MRIRWFLVGDENVGSARIAGINLDRGMKSLGYDSEIVSKPAVYLPDIVGEQSLFDSLLKGPKSYFIFQKVCGERTLAFARDAKAKGHRIVFTAGDWYETEMYRVADAVIVSSPVMQQMVRTRYFRENVHYIDDALELMLSESKDHKPNETLSLGWFGNYTKLKYCMSVFKKFSDKKTSLFTVSNTKSASYCMGAETGIPWEVKKLEKVLLNSVDVFINPIELSVKASVKSANRVTLAMALGIPVVTTPLPTYELVIKHGENGFFAESDEDWRYAINYLRDWQNRKKIGESCLKKVRKEFCLEAIVKKYIEAIK